MRTVRWHFREAKVWTWPSDSEFTTFPSTALLLTMSWKAQQAGTGDMDSSPGSDIGWPEMNPPAISRCLTLFMK